MKKTSYYLMPSCLLSLFHPSAPAQRRLQSSAAKSKSLRGLMGFIAIYGASHLNACQFIIDFDTDDQGNALLTTNSINIGVDQPYADLFGAAGSGLGVDFSAPASNAGPLVLYNTEGDTGEDSDLERHSGLGGSTPGQWSLGNAINSNFGNGLIINRDNDLSTPNDEGTGGTVTISFDVDLLSFGFDYVDLDNADLGTIRFFDSSSTSIVSIPFTQFQNGGVRDVGAAFGNHAGNTIAPITAASLGFTSFNQVEFVTTGSGAIGSITIETVPESSSSALLGAVGVLSLFRRWR